MVTTSHGKTELLRGGNTSSVNWFSMPVRVGKTSMCGYDGLCVCVCVGVTVRYVGPIHYLLEELTAHPIAEQITAVHVQTVMTVGLYSCQCA